MAKQLKSNRVGRNEICPFCDSGKKFKKCCWFKLVVKPHAKEAERVGK